MLAYVIRRLWQMVPTLLGVVLLVFVLFNLVGGDPAYLLAGKISNPEQIENIRRQLGIDQPYYVQLWIFLKQIATGDFGASWATNERVSAIFATRLGPSLTVLLPLLVIATLLAMAAAMLVAYMRGSLTDRVVMIGCTVGQSVSILVYIIVLQYVLAYQLGWFPVQGWGNNLAENLFRFSLLPIIVGVVGVARAGHAAVPQLLSRRNQPGLRAHGAREGHGRGARDVGARAAQRVHSHHHQRDDPAAGAARAAHS